MSDTPVSPLLANPQLNALPADATALIGVPKGHDQPVTIGRILVELGVGGEVIQSGQLRSQLAAQIVADPAGA